jgi:hypothetical protein
MWKMLASNKDQKNEWFWGNGDPSRGCNSNYLAVILSIKDGLEKVWSAFVASACVRFDYLAI